MLTISKTPISLRITNENATILVLLKDKELEFHQSFNSEKKEIKMAMIAHQTIKNILLNKLDKKSSYKERFAKLASMISKESVSTFLALNNRLEKFATA